MAVAPRHRRPVVHGGTRFVRTGSATSKESTIQGQWPTNALSVNFSTQKTIQQTFYSKKIDFHPKNVTKHN